MRGLAFNTAVLLKEYFHPDNGENKRYFFIFTPKIPGNINIFIKLGIYHIASKGTRIFYWINKEESFYFKNVKKKENISIKIILFCNIDKKIILKNEDQMKFVYKDNNNTEIIYYFSNI